VLVALSIKAATLYQCTLFIIAIVTAEVKVQALQPVRKSMADQRHALHLLGAHLLQAGECRATVDQIRFQTQNFPLTILYYSLM
jgi:hypothetical protein